MRVSLRRSSRVTAVSLSILGCSICFAGNTGRHPTSVDLRETPNTAMIAPYNRNSLPEGVDHSRFGSVLPETALTAERCAIDRIACENDAVAFAASTVIAPNAAGTRIYGQCDAKFSRALSGPVHTTLFLPDHAAIIDVNGEDRILHESTWHSELFFSDYFRNDRSTEWKWRTIYKGTPDQSFPENVINCYHRYSYQYFHWFIDVMPRVWLARRSGFMPRDALWFLGPLSQPFQRPSLELLGIRADRICEVPSTATVAFPRCINAAFAFNESVGTLRPAFTSGQYYAGWSDDYFTELRTAAYTVLKLSNQPASKKIFIDRRNSTHRKMLNQNHVLSEVQNAGFEMVDPSAMEFADQVRCFSQARIILATHGAGLTNAIWSPPGAIVAELMPIGLNDVGYRFLAPMCGHRHVVMFCEALPHDLGVAYADIEVDLEGFNCLMRTLSSY